MSETKTIEYEAFYADQADTIVRRTAKEVMAINMHWDINPDLKVARDSRWTLPDIRRHL